MKKKLLIVAAILIIIFAASTIYIAKISQTPHGPLDWRIALFLHITGLQNKGFFNPDKTAAENRRLFDQKIPAMNSSLNKIQTVKDIKIKGKGGWIPLRIYVPLKKKARYPVVLFFHGGGFTIGNLESHDHICRAIATSADSLVIAVDYRLAPEHPFPAAVEDAWTAAIWAYKNAAEIRGDKQNLFTAGDSAGGNLAAVTALRAKNRGNVSIKGQILIYPAVDPGNINTPTMKKYAQGYLLSVDDIKLFTDYYFQTKKDQTHRDAAPLRVKNLKGLPPAFIITAEFDPLRWSNEQYAHRLKESGVSVKIKQYKQVIHGYLNFIGIVPSADETIREIGDFIKKQAKR